MGEEAPMLARDALLKVARHGGAIERLKFERDQGGGEFVKDACSYASALAFDAADYIWAALMVEAPAAQQSRYIRNAMAEALIKVMQEWPEMPPELLHVSEHVG